MKRLRSRNLDEKIERRNDILAIALLEFDENGYDKTTMTSISKRSGLSRTLINFYFKDKKSLHMALEDQALSLLQELISASIKNEENTISQLKKTLSCFITFYQEHRGLYECIIRSDDEVDLKVQLKDKSLAISSPIIDLLKKGVRMGHIKNPYESYEVAAISIWCIAHGYATIISNKHKILKSHWGINTASFKLDAENTIERIFKI